MPKATRRQYIAYEGSLTQPACYETVQWIILNKPIYMTSHLFHSLRQSMQNEGSHGADNYRPIQRVNGRSVRTNIDFASSGTNIEQVTVSNNCSMSDRLMCEWVVSTRIEQKINRKRRNKKIAHWVSIVLVAACECWVTVIQFESPGKEKTLFLLSIVQCFQEEAKQWKRAKKISNTTVFHYSGKVLCLLRSKKKKTKESLWMATHI